MNNKTLTKHFKRLILMLSFFAALNIYADNVQFTVSAPKVVRNGEPFNIKFNINQKPSHFTPPNFDPFVVVGGPYSSQSSNMQWVNGKFTQNISFSYSYSIQPTKAGTFTIPAAVMKYDGKGYKTKPLNIKVVKGNQRANNSQRSRNGQKSQSNSAKDSDIFLRVDLSKTSVYQGEPVFAQMKFYSDQQIVNVGNAKFPQFKGVWTQDLPMPRQISLVTEEFKNNVYSVGVIRKVLLYPQRSGRIKIDPFSYELYINKKVRRASFWDNGYQSVKLPKTSKARYLTVKPLPANAPESFNGAVGNYTMKVSLNNSEVKAHDAITMKVVIRGSGNIKLLEAPKLNFPPDLEIYDPKITNNFSNSENGQTGAKTFEYLLIPKNPGDFILPSIKFSYFDVKRKSYKTLSSREFKIHVLRGELDGSETEMVNGVEKAVIQHISTDIKFIKTKFEPTQKSSFFFGTSKFYILYLIAILIFVLTYLFLQKLVKDKSNVALMRNKKANKISKKRLKQASLYLKSSEIESFYVENLQALWGYLSDKLTIPVSELSRDNINDKLVAHDVSEELIVKFINIVDVCEFARYAPSASSERPEDVFKSTAEIIIELESGIRKK